MLVKLSKILNLEYGKGLKNSQRTNGKYPVIGSSGIIGWHNEYLIEGPGIVIGRKGSIGEVTYIKQNFWPIDTAYYVKTKMNVDLSWLAYLLEKINLKKLGLSDVVPGLKRELVYNQKIALPNPKEQTAIANILFTVDEAIRKADESIKKTERIKQAVLQKLLTEGIPPRAGQDGHREFKDTKIGRMPKEWEVKSIGELGKVYTGKTPSSNNKSLWNGNIPFVTPGDISDSKYVNETERSVSDVGSKVATLLPPNSLMVVCIGSTIGKVALTSREVITNQQINSIIINEKEFYPDFIYYSFIKKSKMFKALAGTAAVPIINKTLFEKFQITISTNKEEQKKIADIVSEFDSKLILLKSSKDKFIRIKRGLMDDLLTGRKRVEVN